MRSLQFLAVFSLTTFTRLTLVIAALTPEQIIEIDKLMTEVFIPRNNVTGSGLSIVEDGEIVYSKGYAKQDVENEIDAHNRTIFCIGSVSKSFVATLVVKTLSELYPEHGESVLDMPIAAFKPNFNFTFMDRYRSEQMSFRDLLSHRSCLESPDKEIVFGSIPTNLEYVYRTRYESEVCGHRGYYVYNNALYGFAAELIASFVDKSLEQMFKDFFVEVGMTDSMVVDLGGSYENLPNLAQGYYQRDGRIHRMNPLLLRREAISLGAGGVLSTATDMGKYMALHLNRGKIGTKQVVSSEAIGWMHTPSIHRGIRPGQSPDPGFAAPHVEYAYGLGLALARVNEFYTTGHAGNSPPYISDMRFYHYGNDQSIGVFITTNGPGGIFGPSNVPPPSISAAIFDIVRTGTNQHKLNEYLKYQAPWTSVAGLASPGMGSKVNAKVKADISPKVDSGRRIEFGEVVGLYGEKIGGDLRIKLDTEDTRFLQVNYGEWGIGRLLPVNGSDSMYLIEWKTDIVQHWYTFPPDVLPVPIYHIDFQPEIETLHLLENGEILTTFVRDATIDTFPAIPWDPASCGPS